MTTEHKVPTVSIRGTCHAEDNCGCDIDGLTKGELEIVEGSLRGGHNWIRRGNNGRLEHVLSYEMLPSPVRDEKMFPFWQRPTEDLPVQLELFSYTPKYNSESASITIQSLCGYYYSEENYRKNAELLNSYGFECMRSQRGGNGKFWEVWYLPGVWSSKGELDEVLSPHRRKTDVEQTKIAIDFLCKSVTFGTLDTSTQRACMPIPD